MIVENAINSHAADTAQNQFTSPINLGNNRIINCGRPAAKGDAVNVSFLRDVLKQTEANILRKTLRTVDMTKAIGFDNSYFDIDGDFGIIAGGIDTTEIADDAITTPKIIAGAVTTARLTTNEIDVGNGGIGMPVQFRVRDNSNNIIGWIGDDSGGTGYVGAWFKTLTVGGTSPSTAPLVATTAGVITLNVGGSGDLAGIGVLNGADGAIAWIGKNGSDYGAWFKTLWVGGTSAANAPFTADGSGNVVMQSISGVHPSIDINDGAGKRVQIDTTNGFKFTGSSVFAQITTGAINVKLTATPTNRTEMLYTSFGVHGSAGTCLVLGNTSGSGFLQLHNTGTPHMYLNGTAGTIDADSYIDAVGGFKVNTVVKIGTSGEILVRNFSQAGRPTLTSGEVAMWYDTSNEYLLINDGANYWKVQMTAA